SVPEGDTGTSTIAFSVSIEAAHPVEDVTGEYLISGGNEDGQTGILTFSAGTTELIQTIPVNTNGDTVMEADEVVSVTLIDPSAKSEIGTGIGSSFFTDDDGATINIDSPSSVPEGDTGTSTIAFTVSIDAAHPLEDITVEYLISGGNEDGQTGTLIFSAGTTELIQTIPVNTNGDTVMEADEVVSVTLIDPSAKSEFGTGIGSSFFTDDDVAGITIIQSDGSTQTSESGTTDSFTVNLASQPMSAVMITVASENPS